MKTDLDRLFPTKTGEDGQVEKKSTPATPWPTCPTLLGGDIKSLCDKDLDAVEPGHLHFGRVCPTCMVECGTPSHGYAERSLADLAAAPAIEPVTPGAQPRPPAAKLIEPVEVAATTAPAVEPSLFDARPAAPVVESDAAVKSAAVTLVEQARPPAVTQPTEPTALVAALTARPGAPVPPVAERSLFDDLATPPVAQPVEATTPAAAIAPAVAAPVEPKPRLAPAEAVNAPAAVAPVTAPAADAQPVELPRGWPSDVPPPDWWAEFTAALDTIWLLSARRQQCGDPACRFLVAVEWAGVEYPPQWACPACGRAAEVVNQ